MSPLSIRIRSFAKKSAKFALALALLGSASLPHVALAREAKDPDETIWTAETCEIMEVDENGIPDLWCYGVGYGLYEPKWCTTIQEMLHGDGKCAGWILFIPIEASDHRNRWIQYVGQ